MSCLFANMCIRFSRDFVTGGNVCHSSRKSRQYKIFKCNSQEYDYHVNALFKTLLGCVHAV